MNQPFSVNQYQLACAEFGISPSEDSDGPTLVESIQILKARLDTLSKLLPPVQEVVPVRDRIRVCSTSVVTEESPDFNDRRLIRLCTPDLPNNHFVLPISYDLYGEVQASCPVGCAWELLLTLEVAPYVDPTERTSTKPTP